jgi:N-acetylneuraminate synthase
MNYIVGEIGINHNGDLELAKKLIDVASCAGIDAVKFQKRTPDICVPEHQKGVMRKTPWGEMTYLEYKYRVEFEKEEYDIIDAYCKERKIEWSASPWDIPSGEFLLQYNLPWIKIPSALITNLDLVRFCGENYDHVVMSTGMSTESEIHECYLTLKNTKCNKITILHCNSEYPASNENLNLRYINVLKEKYPDCEIGYSGHEFGLTSTVAAVALDTTFIERHITLDRTMWGTDHSSSVEPQGMFKLVRSIRELETSLGSPRKIISDKELEVRKKLRG